MYHANSKDGDVAIKIYKTSILVFKVPCHAPSAETPTHCCGDQDRDRYVSGEFRFKNGYCKSNPRKVPTPSHGSAQC